MTLVGIEDIVDNDNLEKQFQVLKSNVKWGRPYNALTYFKLLCSYTPKIYFRASHTDNFGYYSVGTDRDKLITYTGTVNNIDSYVDNTVVANNINGGYYTTSTFSLTNRSKGLFVSCWIKPTGLTTSGDKCVFSKGVSYASADYLLGLNIRYVSGTYRLVAKHGNSQESVQSSTTLTVENDKWYHVCINIKADSKCDIYLNGEQVFTGASTVNCAFTNNTAMYLGVSAPPTTNPYIGSVAELAIREATLSAKTIKKLYQVGATKGYYEPDRDFDTTAFYNTLTQQTYAQFLSSTSAKHHWSLDATDTTASPPKLVDSIAALDMRCYGTLANNGNDSSLISALNGAGGCKRVHGEGNYAVTTAAGTWATAANKWTPVTLSFVLKLTTYSEEADGLLGYAGASTNYVLVDGTTNNRQIPGFSVYVQDNKVRFTVQSLTGGVLEYNTVSTNQIRNNTTVHVAFTIDSAGVGTAYVNGQKQSSVAFTNIKGILPPPSSQRFGIGLFPNFDFEDIPLVYLDEILIWEKALTLSEIIRLYKIQKFGPSYESTIYESGTTTITESYNQNSYLYPELTNTTDVTKYIESYSIQKDLNNVVDSGQLIFVDEWNSSGESVEPGDYIVIKEKYIDRTNQLETPYYDVAHMKVEGSPSYEINATSKNRVIVLRSLLGYLQDSIVSTIVGDKIKVPKTEFNLVNNIGSYRSYAVKNPNDTNRVYDTWAPYPAPKLWATDFNNIGDSGDGGVVLSTDQIRIKGANGGVQIDYGSGIVYANTAYLTSQISRNGLGDPQKLFGEFYRYATPRDIEKNVQLTGVYYDIINDVWCVGFSRSVTCDQTTMFVESGVAKGNIYKITQVGTAYRLRDVNGYIVSPLDEGLAIGDKVRIGDANLGTDVIRKILLDAGFQENDSTAPFYFEIDNVPLELSPTVPELVYSVENNTNQLTVLQQVLEYLPPDFKLIVSPDGVVRGKLYGFNSLDNTAIKVSKLVDTNQDNTDFGVVTKIVAEGQAILPVNVGLHQTYGGTASCRAYKLNNFALDYNSLNGTTLSQASADAKLGEIFSGDPTIPIPTGTGWSYGNPSFNRHYGVIYNRFGDPTDVKRWEYEDTDFVALDIGASSSGAPFLVDKVEVVWINHIIEGNAVAQSLEIYYMTAEDYEAEYGTALDNNPSISDTTYFPDKNSKNWKVLVDEFTTTEGANAKTSSEFTTAKPTGLRFLKFRIGQCQHRFKMQSGVDNNQVISRFSLTDVKVFTSLKITATAELGVTPPFNSVEHKKLAAKYRRRTEYIPGLLFLDTYDKAKDYAIVQLQERFKEYSPYAITSFDPRIQPGQMVEVLDPETNQAQVYMVVATNITQDFLSQCQLINYEVVI